MPARKRMREQSTVGTRIFALRKAHGLKQQALAHMIGIPSRSVISDIERGKRAPSVSELKGMARVFHVSVSYLVGDPAMTEDSAQDVCQLKAAYRAALERIQSCDAERSEAIQDAFSLLEPTRSSPF